MELIVSERWADVIGFEGRYRVSAENARMDSSLIEKMEKEIKK